MTLSFSGSAKEEICRDLPHKRCCCQAMFFGVLLYCNTFTAEGIRIVTESREFGFFLPKLLWRAFKLEFDEFPSMAAPGKLVFQITEPWKLEFLMDAYGFDPESTLSLHVNLSVLEEECCREHFLRGAFLAGGSVTDPAKGYHLELATGHRAVGRETYALLEEILGFYPKLSARGANTVLYFKQSDQISDVLTRLGAPICGMGIIEARLEKELNNKVNRRVNCDGANISKVVDAAQVQLAAIRTLRERGQFDELPEKLRSAALAREDNPEASLTELAAMMEPPITKPAMNNRMKKLMALAGEENG
jgi:DNA-binding protein WhiA